MEIDPTSIETYWPLTSVRVGAILQRSGERMVGEAVSDQGAFVYKVADPWKTPEALDKDTGLFAFLRQAGFRHAPGLLKTRSGEGFQAIDGSLVYLLEYVPGQRPEPTAGTYARLGRVTAELHAIQGYPSQTEFQAKDVIPDLLSNASRYPFADEYARLIRSIPPFESLPQALIHTDINHANAVQTEDGEIVLVDWDDAGVGTRVLDLGLLINQFVTEDLEVKESEARAFYGAYLSRLSLSDDERERVFDASLFFALMYIQYGDTAKRWERIRFCVDQKKRLLSFVSQT